MEKEILGNKQTIQFSPNINVRNNFITTTITTTKLSIEMLMQSKKQVITGRQRQSTQMYQTRIS